MLLLQFASWSFILTGLLTFCVRGLLHFFPLLILAGGSYSKIYTQKRQRQLAAGSRTNSFNGTVDLHDFARGNLIVFSCPHAGFNDVPMCVFDRELFLWSGWTGSQFFSKILSWTLMPIGSHYQTRIPQRKIFKNVCVFSFLIKLLSIFCLYCDISDTSNMYA